MKSLLLIYPKIENIIEKEKVSQEHGIPLALLSISSKLINEYKINIIDMRIEEDYTLLKNYMAQEPICVGISCMTGTQIFNALEIAKKIRNLNNKTPIVWGGWHPSLLPEETLKNDLVDIIVVGQGESSFYELINALTNKSKLSSVSGIYFKKDKIIQKTPPRQFENINDFPPVPFELIDLNKYQNKAQRINYMSSYGCPHRCGFCANSTVFKRRWTGLKAKRVVDELEFLIKKYNYKDVRFEDDNFFVDIERAKEICKEILKRKLKFTWFALARASYISKLDDETMQLIKNAGCTKLLIGTETGSQKVLDYINKDTTLEDTYSFIQKCKKVDITGWHSVIVGFPNESKGVLQETFNLIKYIKKIDSKNEIMVFFYTPFPGTPLYNECIKYGFNPPKSLEEWSKYNITNVTTPWVSDSYRKKVHNFLYYLNMAYPDLKAEERIKNSKIKKLFYQTIRFSSLLRLHFNFYDFPVEIYSWNILKKIINGN